VEVSFLTVVLDAVASTGYYVMVIIRCFPYLSRMMSFQEFLLYCIF